MISLLPGRVIKLLEFIGFSGNKQVGMQDLVVGVRMSGIRQVLCVMTLLGYHLIVCYVLSHQEGDLEFCDQMLNEQLQARKNGRICCRLLYSTKYLWFTDVSGRRMVFIFQRSSRIHERQSGRFIVLVQKIMAFAGCVASVSSFVFLGIAVGELVILNY